MSDVVIRVENLSKRYILSHQLKKNTTFREMITDGAKSVAKKVLRSGSQAENKREDFWALNDVSFDVHHGDRVGIIGRNGSGKSTLLKTLSRIVDPTKGRITIKGRVASLLEVGTGFHSELTGRENVYLNGAILGMSRQEVKRKFDEIVAFSGVERFLDTPVKRYSSGMYVRLAFAVAAHMEPEILIVDEVLAVGDAEFQKKCLGKMEDVSTREGRTVLFVSHDMGAVQALCTRGILLDSGKVAADGDMASCVSKYLGMFKQMQVTDLSAVERLARHCAGDARIVSFRIRNEGSESEIIDSSLPCVAEVSFEVFEDGVQVGAEFTISDDFQKMVLFHSFQRNGLAPTFKKGIHKLVCHTAPLSLVSGSYFVTLALSRPGIPIDYIENAKVIEVNLPHLNGMTTEFKKSSGNGCMYIEHHWDVE